MPPLRSAPALKNAARSGADEISSAFKSLSFKSPSNYDQGTTNNETEDSQRPSERHEKESKEGEDELPVYETPAKTPWRSSYHIGGLQASTVKGPPSPTGSATPSVAASMRSSNKRAFVPHGETLVTPLFAFGKSITEPLIVFSQQRPFHPQLIRCVEQLQSSLRVVAPNTAPFTSFPDNLCFASLRRAAPPLSARGIHPEKVTRMFPLAMPFVDSICR